jgi:hypothetical protein
MNDDDLTDFSASGFSVAAKRAIREGTREEAGDLRNLLERIGVCEERFRSREHTPLVRLFLEKMTELKQACIERLHNLEDGP